jgi:hypothetical protein
MSHQCIRPYGPNTVGVIPRNTDGMWKLRLRLKPTW